MEYRAAAPCIKLAERGEDAGVLALVDRAVRRPGLAANLETGSFGVAAVLSVRPSSPKTVDCQNVRPKRTPPVIQPWSATMSA